MNVFFHCPFSYMGIVVFLYGNRRFPIWELSFLYMGTIVTLYGKCIYLPLKMQVNIRV